MVAQFQWILTRNRRCPRTARARTDNIYLLTVGWKF